MATNPLYQKDILSADQFDRPILDLVTTQAEAMKKIVEIKGKIDLLSGKVITALFYEPSSRTFGSFITAAQRLGAGFIPLQGVVYSSVSKGETLPDTVRTFASYSDMVVLRHPEVGSAKIAAEFSDKPVINAGDGVGEHPTQALLDYFTIRHHFGNMEKLTVALIGDLLNGRTIHSLIRLLMLYPNVIIHLVAPNILKLPEELTRRVKERKITIVEHENLEEVVPEADVLYVTRVQKERFTDLETYERVKHYYMVTPQTLKKAKKKAVIMHPFPRAGEIGMDVDLDPRAIYIKEQIPNGLYVRMAVLALVLLKDHT